MGALALPLLFTPLVSTHFFPSGFTYGTLLNDLIVHPISDHLLGTGTMKVFTHGNVMTRLLAQSSNVLFVQS